jgi:hypothetical protein
LVVEYIASELRRKAFDDDVRKTGNNISAIRLIDYFKVLVNTHAFQLGYYVIKGTDCFVSSCVIVTEGNNVTVNSVTVIGTTEYLTL